MMVQDPSARAIEFLHESNVIEDITNVDYPCLRTLRPIAATSVHSSIRKAKPIPAPPIRRRHLPVAALPVIELPC
jgi:hypothetical protein